MGRALLVDPNTARAASLAQRFGANGIAASLDEVLDRIDGALILTPPCLHFSLALQCLRQGKHVLSEKPLVERATEVDTLVREAAATGVCVAVNNVRRLVPAHQAVRTLVQSGSIGVVRRIDITFGEPYDWPLAGDGHFGSRGGGRGVLADLGAHLLDLACWWLGAEPTLDTYCDDSFGGTEAVAHVDLRGPQSTLSIRLSWLSKLSNSYQIEGSEATVEGSLYEFRSFTISKGSRTEQVRVKGPNRSSQYGDVLLDNFLEVVAGRSAPLVSASDVRPSIALIEACYANRQRFDVPWHEAFTRLLHA